MIDPKRLPPATATAGAALLVVYLALHPARNAWTVAHTPYAAIHAIGIVAMVLILAGLTGVLEPAARAAGRLGSVAFLAAFCGTAIEACGIVLDAYMNPLLATFDPGLVHTGTGLDRDLAVIGPALLVLPAGAALFVAGQVALAALGVRTRTMPRPAAALLGMGALLMGPGPFVPLGVEQAGGVLFAAGLAWLSLAAGRAGQPNSAARSGRPMASASSGAERPS